MNETLNFLCLFGGPSSEYEVSLVSAYGVLSNLPKEVCGRPVAAFPVGVTKDGRWLFFSGGIEHIRDGSFVTMPDECAPAALLPGGRLLIGPSHGKEGGPQSVKIHVAFPVMHGAFGEDGKLQGLLACLGVPFVGADWASSVCCMDKSVTKSLLTREGIPQAKWLFLRRAGTGETAFFEDARADRATASLPYTAGRSLSEIAARVKAQLGYPVFVKPASAGSSVGCVKVKEPERLAEALEGAFREGDRVLVEEYIAGKEVEAAVLEEGGSLFIPAPGEIDPGAEFYDYNTKYKNDTASYYIPPRIPAACAEEIRRLAGEIFHLLGCKGLARVDFFVTPDGRVVFNEINTLPGFTPISMYAKMMAAAGVGYGELLARLLAGAMRG